MGKIRGCKAMDKMREKFVDEMRVIVGRYQRARSEKSKEKYEKMLDVMRQELEDYDRFKSEKR